MTCVGLEVFDIMIDINLMNMKKIIFTLATLSLPVVTFAMPATVTELLGRIATLFLNPLIILGFVVATIYLFYAIIEMIWKSGEGDLADKRKSVMYAVIGLLIMFSVYGILRLALATFGIPCDGFFCRR